MSSFKIRLTTLLVLFSSSAFARDLTFHGPIIQWHRDPLTEATITWVEETSEADVASPVWREGKAGFGYGDGDDETLLEIKGESPRLYISKTFHLDSIPEEGTELKLVIKYDDAFVAWLNGTEIARSPNIKRHHLEAKVRGGHEATEFETFVVGDLEMLFKEGTNLLSIEGHNVRKSSSDFSLDPSFVVGDRTVIPPGSTWRYVAGVDPPRRWFLTHPALEPEEPLPKAEKSEWTLGYRRRFSRQRYTLASIDERELADTGNPVFEARIDKLRPGTAYEYLLAAEGREVFEGWFRTAPAFLSKPMNFVVGGDMGTTTAVPVCRLAGELDAEFGLLGGDLAYANGRDDFKWYDWLDNWRDLVVGKDGRSIPMIAIIGNHEMKGLAIRRSGAPFYFSLFDLPTNGTNFTVDFGKYMSIVCLDSNHAQPVRRQTLWLNGQLDGRKEIPNLFAIYHRPAWGTGVKRNIGGIQKAWTPLFEKYGVDCVFENDHHTYKRSKKILGGVPNEEQGVLHIGDGAWGARIRPIVDSNLNRVGARSYLEKWEARHHLVQVTISPNGMKQYEAIAPGQVVFDEVSDRGTPPQSNGR